MSDQSTTRAAASADIHRAGHQSIGGRQTSRRTFLKASGALVVGAAPQLPPAGAAVQGAVAAENGPRDIIKRDPPASSLVSSIAEFVHGTGFGDLPYTIRRLARHHLLDTIGCCLAAARPETSRAPGDAPIACVGFDVRGWKGSGDRDFHSATITSATGRLHERTARAGARIRRYGDARSAPLRRDRAARLGALRMAARRGGAGDRRLRHWARALSAAGSRRLRSCQP